MNGHRWFSRNGNSHANGKGQGAPKRHKRILVTGAAGAPALNYIRSLRLAAEQFHFIGVDCNKYQLLAAETDEKHLVPRCSDPEYVPVLKDIIEETGADFLFAQPDVEIGILSQRRDELPVRTFWPRAETISICQDKFRTFERWAEAGLPVPTTRLIETEDDLARVLSDFGDIWLRAAEGAAGRGAFHTADFDQAKMWLDSQRGWGTFTAARYLSPHSVTWQSVWHSGELMVAQGRERLQWEFADRAPSGVTGITGAGITIRDEMVDDIARRAIFAIDERPHGIFAVDMTRDREGVPNPTEINIGRFFTTSLFFAAAGLNMPYIYTKLAFGEEPPLPAMRVNPLDSGLLWVRGMDREPILAYERQAETHDRRLEERRWRVRVRETGR